MTLTFTVVGFSFVFENENFVCFAVFNNFSNNFCTFNYGLANLNISIIYNGQNFFKNYKKKQTAARMLVDLLAEGEKQAAITRAEGEKESAILRAEAVKQQRIREAEGEAEALLTVQKAQADAIRMINEANPNHNYLALRSMEAMEKVADGKATKLIVPSDMQNLAATVSAIKEISGEVTE